MKRYELKSLEMLPQAAHWVLDNLGEKKIVAFYADMGVGKTTLIKQICSILGSSSTVTSPTFAIINEYPLNESESIFHFDFYRLLKFQELVDIGFEEYLYSGNLCFIEWPEIAEPLLPAEILKVSIKLGADSSRVFEVIA